MDRATSAVFIFGLDPKSNEGIRRLLGSEGEVIPIANDQWAVHFKTVGPSRRNQLYRFGRSFEKEKKSETMFISLRFRYF